ncbi:hypothetical protein IJ818_01450 [bacterium]|nr:hypothetical protein [bacterium]
MNNIEKLLKSLGENVKLSPDAQTLEHIYVSGNKKWIANITPAEVLSRSVKDSINSLMTLNEDGNFYERIPKEIKTPNYGDNWGRFANYIEINNRAIAEMENNRCKNGLLSTIKLLPAIPPSAKSWANCIILSQIFPNIYGDGYNKGIYEENSIYGIKLNHKYSENIISTEIEDKISAETQLKAFNDLAHFHGLKTGFRTVISADQIKISDDIVFDWKNKQHEELFIREHVKLINTGFEALFIDSAKHIGGYDMQNYAGVGELPKYEQMQYILHEIRKRSKKTTISFAGEKSTEDFNRYENLGLTTGTAFVEPDNYDEVKNWSIKFKYNRNYAPGIEVSNDNDTGGRPYESRLNRINSILFAYEYPSDKLPSFMQMEDIFPLRYDTNTHHLMMTNPSYSTDGSPKSHFENLFAKEDGKAYNAKVADLFIYALNM